MQQALAAPDGHRALALVVEHGVDIYARVAPLGPTIQAAASADPDIDTYWQSVAQTRRAGMAQLIASLTERGHLRSGLTPQRATDILYVIFSHETFLGLTRDAEWTVPEYKAWLYRVLATQLLNADSRSDDATAGLSYHHLVR